MASQAEKIFIKENYPTNGSKYCAEKLNINHKKVVQIAYHMGIKINKKVFINKNRFRKHLFDINIFTTNINQYSAYVLGFIWADGHIQSMRYKITTEIVEADANAIKNIFLKTGQWRFIKNNSPSKRKWKPQIAIYCTNKQLYKVFKDNDYSSKNASPTKILKLIPKKYHNYFFRGVSDGDGCFYYNEKCRLKQYNLSSCFDQNWKYIKILMNDLSIKNYSIKKYSRFNKKTKKSNRYSCLRINSKESIKKLGEYLYSGEQFGLVRKFNIYEKIINS